MALNRNDSRMGKGLDALFSKPITNPHDLTDVDDKKIYSIRLEDIKPNPFQPRKSFNHESIIELADSIKKRGIIQPILLRKKNNDIFEIISGERRWRACKKLNLETISAQVTSDLITDEDMMEIAIIENIQRENLNAIEISNSYQNLIENCKLTQIEVAIKLSTKRSSVANYLRLQNLSNEIKDSLADQKISMGHAKIILSLEDKDLQLKLHKLIIANDYSVRKTEKIAKELQNNKVIEDANTSIDSVFVTEQEEKLSRRISGRKVRIKVNKDNSGLINIKFNSEDELKAIFKSLKI